MKSPVKKFSNPEWLNRFIPICCVPADVLLDVGAGIRPQNIVKAKTHICVEPHGEYCDVLRDKGLKVLQATGQEALPEFRDNEVDTVTLLDVVEHLPKDESLEMLRHAIRIAKKQVVVLTPLGYMPQTCATEAADPWGLHGNVWQEHRSGWELSDFEGWQVFTCDTFHTVSYQGDHHIPLDHPNGAIWAIFTKWENLTYAEKCRIGQDFNVLRLWVMARHSPRFLWTALMLFRHRIVVTFKVKEALHKLGIDVS